MKQPLFEIGETVVRQSKTYSHANGDYKIQGVISGEVMQQLHPHMAVEKESLYYNLIGFAVTLPYGGISNHSNEKFLFKKHKGCGEDFNSMINALKTPVKENA